MSSLDDRLDPYSERPTSAAGVCDYDLLKSVIDLDVVVDVAESDPAPFAAISEVRRVSPLYVIGGLVTILVSAPIGVWFAVNGSWLWTSFTLFGLCFQSVYVADMARCCKRDGRRRGVIKRQV